MPTKLPGSHRTVIVSMDPIKQLQARIEELKAEQAYLESLTASIEGKLAAARDEARLYNKKTEAIRSKWIDLGRPERTLDSYIAAKRNAITEEPSRSLSEHRARLRTLEARIHSLSHELVTAQQRATKVKATDEASRDAAPKASSRAPAGAGRKPHSRASGDRRRHRRRDPRAAARPQPQPPVLVQQPQARGSHHRILAPAVFLYIALHTANIIAEERDFTSFETRAAFAFSLNLMATSMFAAVVAFPKGLARAETGRTVAESTGAPRP